MPEIIVRQETAHYMLRGEGEQTLVFVHGAGGNSLHWVEMEPPSGWRLVAVDLPGHGKSGGSAKSNVFAYADWVADFIRAIGGCTALAGHSMGGAITMALALSCPELVRGLILVGTGAKLGVSPVILDLCRTGIAARVEDQLANMAYGPLPSREQIREWYQMFGQATCHAYLMDFTACNRFDIRERLGEISHPTLIACGKDDRLTPFKYSEYLLAHLPNAQLTGIEDAGHMVMMEQPTQLNHSIKSFCESL
ncbi:MAG: alpha/beta hydrolase [Bacillota bacterium]|nr:alpha/beta hydrolase [Bacillota bacterium]MDW7683143.1 alpha/beta hydrolase [Bacillota bacterium]